MARKKGSIRYFIEILGISQHKIARMLKTPEGSAELERLVNEISRAKSVSIKQKKILNETILNNDSLQYVLAPRPENRIQMLDELRDKNDDILWKLVGFLDWYAGCPPQERRYVDNAAAKIAINYIALYSNSNSKG